MRDFESSLSQLRLLLVGALVGAFLGLLGPVRTSFAAQEEGSAKERKRAAEEEQRERRRAKAEAERAAEDEESRAAEEARLAEMGAPAAELLEGRKGFFVRLDAFSPEPSGAGRTIARAGDVVSAATTASELDSEWGGDPVTMPGAGRADAFSIQNERNLRLDYGGKVTPQLELGWRRGKGDAISLRYWSYSGSSSLAVSSFLEVDDGAGGPGLIVGGIDNQGFENLPGAYDADPSAFDRPLGTPRLPVEAFLSGADSVSARGSFDASRLDLLYSRIGLVRPRLELHYRVGLSLLQAERRESATFTWRSFPATLVAQDALAVESLAASAKTDAYGFLVGVGGRFGLTESRRWSLRAGLELSGMTNKQELRFRDAEVLSLVGLEPTENVTQDTHDDPASNMLTTLDAELGLEGRVGKGGRVSVGWRHATWLESLSAERFPSAANTAQLLLESLDLDFSGPYVRIGWYF